MVLWLILNQGTLWVVVKGPDEGYKTTGFNESSQILNGQVVSPFKSLAASAARNN